MDYQDYYRRSASRDREPGRDQEGLPQARPAASPGQQPGDKAAEQRFKAINEANEVLSDPDKREQYDQLGKDWEAYARAGAVPAARRWRTVDRIHSARAARSRATPRAGRPAASATSSGPAARRRASATSSTTFFAGAAAADGRGGAPVRTSRAAATGGPSFEDILAGMGIDAGIGRRPAAGRTVAAARPDDRRRGRGRDHPRGGVPRARAGSSRSTAQRLEVTIPRGVDDRQPGQAHAARDPAVGRPRRRRRVKPHPVFTRHGADLEREVPVTLGEALLGARSTVGDAQGPRPAHGPGRDPERRRTSASRARACPRSQGATAGRPVRPDPRRPADRPSDEAPGAAAIRSSTSSTSQTRRAQTREP